jgi:hypothetical protein
MATLTDLRHAYKQRHAPLFAKAQAVEQRLAAAAALGTIHAARLRKLRSHVRYAIAEYGARGLAGFLELWGPCFAMTIDDAQKAAGAELAEAAE